jgi:hypothetical protein
MRGLRPMSPRTSTWTETLGSSDERNLGFGGECLMYRLGSISRMMVRVVEAITASVRRRSNMFGEVASRTCWEARYKFNAASLRIHFGKDRDERTFARQLLSEGLLGTKQNPHGIVRWKCEVPTELKAGYQMKPSQPRR